MRWGGSGGSSAAALKAHAFRWPKEKKENNIQLSIFIKIEPHLGKTEVQVYNRTS